jgi:hypothetical protein
VGENKRDSTNASAGSAKVIPLRSASSRGDLPAGYLEQVARRIRANLSDLVATADSYHLDLATEFRFAARLLNEPSANSHAVQAAEAGAEQLADATGGHWALVGHDGTVLGLAVAIDGRLVVARTSWSRREVLAAGGTVLLVPLTSLGVSASTSGRDAPPPLGTEAAERLDYVMQHPRNVDLATVADLHEQAQSLTKQYDLAASTSLLPAAGACYGQVRSLRNQAPDGRVRRELEIVEAQLATLMGQLVWDASQRATTQPPSATTTKRLLPRTRLARRRRRRTRAFAKATSPCTASTIPGQGSGLAQQAAALVGSGASHALAGLALLHAGEGHAMLGQRSECEATLGAAEAHLEAMQADDPAHGLFSSDRLGRVRGSCYLALGDGAKAGPILESTARSLQGRHKSKAIVLGNPGPCPSSPARRGARGGRAPQGD